MSNPGEVEERHPQKQKILKSKLFYGMLVILAINGLFWFFQSVSAYSGIGMAEADLELKESLGEKNYAIVELFSGLTDNAHSFTHSTSEEFLRVIAEFRKGLAQRGFHDHEFVAARNFGSVEDAIYMARKGSDLPAQILRSAEKVEE